MATRETSERQNGEVAPNNPTQLVVDSTELPSAALRRLVKEVENEAQSVAGAYNRTHNRHNRGR